MNDRLIEIKKEFDRIKTEIAIRKSEQKKRLKIIKQQFNITNIKDIEKKKKDLSIKRKKKIRKKKSLLEEAEKILDDME